MIPSEHHRRLEKMYARAAINALYQPIMSVADGQCEISMPVSEKFFHSAGALHGSGYFKILDDAACFAAWTREQELFVVTASFTMYITRPIFAGHLRAVGKVSDQSKTQFIVEATAYDDLDRAVAHGNGIMMRGRAKLAELKDYSRN